VSTPLEDTDDRSNNVVSLVRNALRWERGRRAGGGRLGEGTIGKRQAKEMSLQVAGARWRPRGKRGTWGFRPEGDLSRGTAKRTCRNTNSWGTGTCPQKSMASRGAVQANLKARKELLPSTIHAEFRGEKAKRKCQRGIFESRRTKRIVEGRRKTGEYLHRKPRGGLSGVYTVDRSEHEGLLSGI